VITYKTVFLVALVALIPLIITPGTLFYFDVTPKIILLLVGLAVMLPWIFPWPLPGSRAARLLYALLSAQVLSLSLSTLFSQRIGLSLYGSNWRSLGLLTHLLLVLLTLVTFRYLAGDCSRLQVMLRGIAGAGALLATYGILQYFGWDPWLPAAAYHAGDEPWAIVRPPGTMGHADYFANYLVVVVFAGTALAAADRGFFRAAGAGAALLSACAIVLSGTRMALLAVVAGGLYLAWRIRPKISRRALAVLAGVVICIPVFYWSPAGLRLRTRVHWIADDPRGGARLLLWRDSLRFAARHSLLGSGPETFPALFPQSQSAELARAYPDFYYESPHNIFLDALSAQGLPGLAILLALIGLGIRAGAGATPRHKAFLSAALIGMVAGHLFTVLIFPTAMYFYLLVAMLVALDAQPAPQAGPRWIALPATAALLFFAFRLLAADRYLELARREVAAGRVTDAIAHYGKANEFGLSADLWLARSLALPAPEPAMQAAVRATAGEDAQNAWYTVAWLYARGGDVVNTERALRATIKCAPNWFKPHWMLAQILQREGRVEEAGAEATLAASLNAGKNLAVTQTPSVLRHTVPGR
jgi:O-antigen ligase